VKISRESQTGLAVLGQTVWHQAAQAHGYPGSIEQRISLITLGVSDPARSRAFYEALGWLGQEAEDTVFFQVGGMVLVLWDRRKLAADAGVEDRTTDGFGGIALAHNVRTAGEVDELLALVEAAGATVTKPPATTFYGGYAGYFSDPDGHVWEIAHNPAFSLGQDGTLVLPDFGADN
jgi:catechol 2,3-dioxygenase-like lactoylglutathione lyase family enzyme